MKIVKTILRNRIGNQFMNDCIICFVEPAMIATISDAVIIDRFQKMKNRPQNASMRVQLVPLVVMIEHRPQATGYFVCAMRWSPKHKRSEWQHR